VKQLPLISLHLYTLHNSKMPRTIVFSEAALPTPRPCPSYAASHISDASTLLDNDLVTSRDPSSSLSIDFFTLTWLLSFLAFFFVTDNYMRTQRHNQAKWYDMQTSKAAYAYECKPASAREDDDQMSQEMSRQEPGMLSRYWDGLMMGASMMMVA